MVEEDKDPFAEFGGVAVEQAKESDPFSEFGGTSIEVQEKKNSLPESTTPLQQPTTPSATSTSESEPTAPVTGTPTPEGMQLQDVEIVAEKPNILEKARGAFNYGLESYVKDITDYDLLRSNAPAQRKIELLEQRRAEQLPIGDQDIIQQAAGMVGGTIKGLAKSVGAGILAAPATPLASVVAATGVAMGDGWKQGYTSSFKEAYYQAIDEGKTPEQAIEIAQNVGETGAVGGAVEGAFGAIPLTKGATTLIKPSSKLLKKGIEYVLDAAIDGSVAAGAQVATNIEAQREGLKRDTGSGAMQSFAGEAIFSGVSNAAHPVYKLISKHTIGRIATDKVKPEDRKDALTIAATQPIEAVNAAVTEAVAQGEITEARGVEITADVVKRKKALEAMPSNMSLDEKNDLADKIEQRQLLESELDKVDEATKPFVELQINQIDKSIPIPLPPKYMDTAGQNTSELKDGQLYITRKGDVRMWDAAQKQFLEPPKSFEVEAKKETEQVKPTQDDSQNKSRVSSEVGKRQEPIEAKPIETRGNEAVIGGGDVQTQGQEVTAQPEVATEQPAVETVQAEAEVAPESQVKPLQTEAESQVETLPTAGIDQVDAEVQGQIEEDVEATDEKEALLGEWSRLRRFFDMVEESKFFEGQTIDDVADAKEKVIADNLRKFRREDFIRVGDRNNITLSIAKKYFGAKNERPAHLDTLVEEISSDTGVKITEQDVIDFVLKYPNGIGSEKSVSDKTFYGYNNPKKKAAKYLYDIEVMMGEPVTPEMQQMVYEQFQVIDERLKEIDAKTISEQELETLNNEYQEYLNTLTDEQRQRELDLERAEQDLESETDVEAERVETIFDQYDNTKGASKKDKVIEQFAKESGKDKAERVRDIIDNFDAIKSRLQELISEGKIDNIEIRC